MKKSIFAVLLVLGLSSCNVEAGRNGERYHIRCTENGYDIVDENVVDYTLVSNNFLTWTNQYGKTSRVFNTSCRIDDL